MKRFIVEVFDNRVTNYYTCSGKSIIDNKTLDIGNLAILEALAERGFSFKLASEKDLSKMVHLATLPNYLEILQEVDASGTCIVNNVKEFVLFVDAHDKILVLSDTYSDDLKIRKSQDVIDDFIVKNRLNHLDNVEDIKTELHSFYDIFCK